MRFILPVVVALAAGVLAGAGTVPAAAGPAAEVAGSTYTPVPPVRVLDTRGGSRVGAQETITLDLGARVPATATAVVLNVTGLAPTASTFVTAWPSGTARPVVSNLNLARGEVRPILVTVAVGPSRTVDLYNNAGTIDLVADLAGHYGTGTGALFTGREAETVATQHVGARGTVEVDLSPYVPASATAVVLNVTGTRPTAGTFVTAWPSGSARPTASNLNLVAGQTSANLATVPLGTGRKVSLYNNAGTVDVITTLAGFYTPEYGAVFTPVDPVRVFDTRTPLGTGSPTAAPITAKEALPVRPGAALPDNAVSAVVNLTGVAPSTSTYLTLFQPSVETEAPGTSNLNLAPGQIASNLVVARIESNAPWARTWAYNHNGTVHAVADLAGYFWVRPTQCATTGCAAVWGDNGISSSTGTGLNVDEVRPLSPVGLDHVAAIADRAAVRTDGTVWTWGDNSAGQLGTGWRGGDSTVPLRVTDLTGVVAVATAERAAIALRDDGTVWAWGTNDRGLLGRTGTAPSAVPVRVAGLSGVTGIAAKYGAAYAVRSDGTVWAWGVNTHAQLGRAGISDVPQPIPAQVPGVTGATSVRTSGYQTYALRGDGTVLAWGANFVGELGVVTEADRVPTPVQVTGLTGVTAIAGQSVNGFAVRSDGTVWGWGSGGSGVLGIEDACSVLPDCFTAAPVRIDGLAGIVDVAAMGDSVLALDASGQVWGWGGNMSGELAGAPVSGIYTEVPLALPGLSDVARIAAGNWGGRAIRR